MERCWYEIWKERCCGVFAGVLRDGASVVVVAVVVAVVRGVVDSVGDNIVKRRYVQCYWGMAIQ